MKLYILRHGETPWNVMYRLQGQTDIELNEKGRALAIETGKGLKDVSFDAVYSSQLSRARETAALVLGDRAEEIPVILEPRIQEISFGVLEGAEFPPEQRANKEHPMYNFFKNTAAYRAPENGEDLDDVCARVKDFLDEITSKEANQDRTFLISTHGCASRAILQAIDPVERANYWRSGVPKNCAVSVAEYKDGTWRLLQQDLIFY